MKIPSLDQFGYWHQIAAHSTSQGGNGAPWPVQVQLAALVGEDGIAGSAAHFSKSGPTVWSVVAVTEDGRLVKVVVEFASEGHDLEAEGKLDDQALPEHKVLEASVRRLKDVVGLEIGKAAFRRTVFNQLARDELDVGDIRLKFLGIDDELRLGIDQLALPYHEDRNRSDRLIAAIRTSAGL